MSAQTEIPGIEISELAKVAQEFVEQKTVIEEEKEKLDRISLRVIQALKKSGRSSVKVNVSGFIYEFNVVDTVEKLKCIRK